MSFFFFWSKCKYYSVFYIYVCVCVCNTCNIVCKCFVDEYIYERMCEDVYMCVCACVNEKHILYLIEALPEWSKAKMIRFQLMNIQGSATWYWRSNWPSSWDFVSLRNYFFRRTTPTTTVSSAARVAASFTKGCTSISVIALPWLCLIEYLRNHKLSFFLFFMLTKVVLMHDPISLFGSSIFSKIGVED